MENRPGGDGIVSLQAFKSADDDHTLWFGPAGIFTVLPYDHDSLPLDIQHDLVPVVSVSDVVLAVSVPASLNINSIDELIALAKAQPGKLNAAASQGISDFLLFGWIKDRGLDMVKVPYRDIMQAPNDLAQEHSGALDVVRGGAAAEGPGDQGAHGDQQRAPTAPEIRPRPRISGPHLKYRRNFGPRGISTACSESTQPTFVCSADPVIPAHWRHRRSSISGPKKFSASVKNQQDHLAVIAKSRPQRFCNSAVSMVPKRLISISRAKNHRKVRDIYERGTAGADLHRPPFVVHRSSHIPGRFSIRLAHRFEATKDIARHDATPDPNVCCPQVQAGAGRSVVRGFLTGVTDTAIWTRYGKGQRDFGGLTLPEGMKKNQKLPQLLFDPTTKEAVHDRVLTPEQMIAEGFVTRELFDRIKATALKLFVRGQDIAARHGLVLVDTKYEFGTDANGDLVLIDDHTRRTRRATGSRFHSVVFAAGESHNISQGVPAPWFIKFRPVR